MNNIVKFMLDAYTLSQIAETWKCDEQTVIQLAIDGLLRLSVRTKHGKLVEFDDEGEPIYSLSPFPLSFGRYLFLDVEDLVEIDKHGQSGAIKSDALSKYPDHAACLSTLCQ